MDVVVESTVMFKSISFVSVAGIMFASSIALAAVPNNTGKAYCNFYHDLTVDSSQESYAGCWAYTSAGSYIGSYSERSTGQAFLDTCVDTYYMCERGATTYTICNRTAAGWNNPFGALRADWSRVANTFFYNLDSVDKDTKVCPKKSTNTLPAAFFYQKK